MAVKQTKGPRNLPTLSISRPSKIYQKLGFWVENNPSGNPDVEVGLSQGLIFSFIY
jgi:hypothetical protein